MSADVTTIANWQPGWLKAMADLETEDDKLHRLESELELRKRAKQLQAERDRLNAEIANLLYEADQLKGATR